MRLSKFFTLEEMLVSETAARLGINNEPTPEVIDNLTNLCRNVLDPLREALGVPVVVTSGYRCQTLNDVIGGSRSSEHLYGRAADIIVPGYTPLQVCESIVALKLPFRQCIHEFRKWTHVSASDDLARPKRETLTALNKDGRTTYLPGLLA